MTIAAAPSFGIPAAAAAIATAALAAMPGERAGSAAVAAVAVSASLLVVSGTADNDADDDGDAGVLLLRAAAIAGGFAAFAAVAARAAAEPTTGLKSLRGRGTGPRPVGYNFKRFLLEVYLITRQPFWGLLRLLGTKQKVQTKGNMNCCKKTWCLAEA